jgi:streptogramin lyase
MMDRLVRGRGLAGSLAFLMLSLPGRPNAQQVSEPRPRPIPVWEEVPIPRPDAGIGWIAACSDRLVYFSEAVAGRVGVLHPDGSLTEFVLSPETASPAPLKCVSEQKVSIVGQAFNGIFVGIAGPEGLEESSFRNGISGLCVLDSSRDPDGSVWFPWMWCHSPHYMGLSKMGPDGEVVDIALGDDTPLLSYPWSVAAVGDGSAWVTIGALNVIRRLDRGNAHLEEISVPEGSDHLTWGRFGELVFSLENPAGVGWLTAQGDLRKILLRNGDICKLPRIAVGPAGEVWAAQRECRTLSRIRPWEEREGLLEFEIPWGDDFPGALSVTPDGSVWFTMGERNSLGHLTLIWPPDSRKVPEPER